ncbi:MAG: hypothetical protein ACRC3I_08080, partial [Cetobacterium sp.]
PSLGTKLEHSIHTPQQTGAENKLSQRPASSPFVEENQVRAKSGLSLGFKFTSISLAISVAEDTILQPELSIQKRHHGISNSDQIG